MKNYSLSQLKWACRRGMLELDLLLENFLREDYFNLPEKEQSIFVKLLQCEDQDLFLWLTGKEVCTDQDFNHLIQKIRYHAAHRHSS